MSELKVTIDQVTANSNSLAKEKDTLKSELAKANEMLSVLEESMKQASATIDELKKQLMLVINERDQLAADTEAKTHLLKIKEADDKEKLQLQQEIARCKEMEEMTVSLRERNEALETELLAKQKELELLRDAERERESLAKNHQEDEATSTSTTSRETLTRCLEGERAAVSKLTDSLQTKEKELTSAVDQYLRLKVLADKYKEEMAALRQRMKEQDDEMMALQSTNEGNMLERQQMVSQLQAELQKVLKI